jgi:hypothetical protein
MQPMRLLVTDTAAQSPRQATAWLIMTFVKNNLFYIPLAALIAFSLIYRNDLGLKSVLIYWIIWAVALGIAVALKLQPILFTSFQALLAAIMYIHVKKNQAF